MRPGHRAIVLSGGLAITWVSIRRSSGRVSCRGTIVMFAIKNGCDFFHEPRHFILHLGMRFQSYIKVQDDLFETGSFDFFQGLSDTGRVGQQNGVSVRASRRDIYNLAGSFLGRWAMPGWRTLCNSVFGEFVALPPAPEVMFADPCRMHADHIGVQRLVGDVGNELV